MGRGTSHPRVGGCDRPTHVLMGGGTQVGRGDTFHPRFCGWDRSTEVGRLTHVSVGTVPPAISWEVGRRWEGGMSHPRFYGWDRPTHVFMGGET